MDKIIFTFPCLFLLGLVLTATAKDQFTTTAANNRVVMNGTVPLENSVNSSVSTVPLENSVNSSVSTVPLENSVNSSVSSVPQGNSSSNNSSVDPKYNNETNVMLPTTSVSSIPSFTEKDSKNHTETVATTSSTSTQTGSTPKPTTRSTTSKVATTLTSRGPISTRHVPQLSSGSNKGLIVFWIFFIVIVVLIVFFFIRKKLKEKSITLHSRQEDLPLSAADQDVVFDNSPTTKEMQTFTPVDLDSTEVLVEYTAETKDGEVDGDPPPPASPADKPGDVAPEGAVAPGDVALGGAVAPGDVPPSTLGVETDDELAVSNKTSVESVNVNDDDNTNNNNIRTTSTRGRAISSSFSDVPLDNPA
ncbi:hypothetical protein UPYG_G00045670 [Umbra pygmaea]|uniref:Uncharacterized protein n=1 Tax=Umbra pygmaea TaxID=75934 RepID=A0ABD0XQX7_UMBPY